MGKVPGLVVVVMDLMLGLRVGEDRVQEMPVVRLWAPHRAEKTPNSQGQHVVKPEAETRLSVAAHNRRPTKESELHPGSRSWEIRRRAGAKSFYDPMVLKDLLPPNPADSSCFSQGHWEGVVIGFYSLIPTTIIAVAVAGATISRCTSSALEATCYHCWSLSVWASKTQPHMLLAISPLFLHLSACQRTLSLVQWAKR